VRLDADFEVLVEDDEARRAIVLVRVTDEDAARARVRYMLEPTAARIVEVRRAFLQWRPA
jgi:hypothetical protein